MIFPEIADRLSARVKGYMANRGGTPTLGLKAGGVGLDWYARNGFQGIFDAVTNNAPAWSGEPVSMASAMNHSVVWACNRVISEPVGFLPLVMLRSTPQGKQLADQHPMYSALKNAPNDDQTAQIFRETLTSHCVMRGNAFGKINRRSGTGVAISIDPLLPTQVDVGRDSLKRMVQVVRTQGEADKTYTVVPGKPQDILHIRGIGNDGLRGYSVLTMARQSWGTALAGERNVARFYANGGRVPYVLETSKQFKDDEQYKQWRANWEETYSQPHKAPILENDLKYKQIGLSHADSQMLETRQFNIPEISRWFLVSPHLVGDLSRATFSNIEQLALEFVKMTLTAWLTRWEQELWRCLLTPEEKSQGYFFRHNLSALLRGDFASRMAGYATMLQNGVACVDEVRDLEDWNPLSDGAGEGHYIQLNMQPIPAGGAPAAAQAAALVRLGKERVQ